MRSSMETNESVPQRRNGSSSSMERGSTHRTLISTTLRCRSRAASSPPSSSRSGFGRGSSLLFADLPQRARVADEKPRLLGIDEPVLLPAAHDSDRRLDRRPEQVRDLLPRERERNEDPVRPFLPHARRERREEPGGAVFDGSEQIGHVPVHVQEAHRQAGEKASRDFRAPVEQREERPLRNRDDARGLERDSRGREGAALEGGYRS